MADNDVLSMGVNDTTISIAVVENHQHALYHIHRKIRSISWLGKSWSMLHFDSHADLACPGKHIPAVACFRPNDSFPQSSAEGEEIDGDTLYDLLDASASGIAEWILPLVLAADLRTVLWVRPHHYGGSIPRGRHKFHVGVSHGLKNGCAGGEKSCASFVDLPSDGVTKVDSKLLYYVEDESYVPTDKLLLPQVVCLHVLEEGDCLEESFHDDLSTPVLLDICLDYFCCRNPFLFDLEVVDRNASRVILDALSSSVIYNGSRSPSEPESLLQQIQLFRTNFDAALKLLTAQDEPPSRTCILSLLGAFYDSELESNRISKELCSLHPLCDDFVSLASESLPYLLLPHDDFSSDKERRQEKVEERICTFRRVLRSYIVQSTRHHRPFLITIARSSDDGFTPDTVVDQLQSLVLEVIREELPSCRLDVNIDYDA